MSYIIGVDSGGTFTDCVVVGDLGTVVRTKSPSTPPRFEEGVVASVSAAAGRLGLSLDGLLAETSLFLHGTTVATNILITRSGAKVALLTTRGHEDAILIGRTVQKVAGLTESEIIDVARLAKAEPLVPRSRIYGIDERIDRNGAVVVPLNSGGLNAVIEQVKSSGAESVAISFLWSFLNQSHEQRVAKEVRGRATHEGRRLSVSVSSDLVPTIKEYERTATTVINAYVGPGVSDYLAGMEERLRRKGLTGGLGVMHSAGGLSSVADAKDRGVTLLSSGPAGGMLGTTALAQELDLESAIATDVGGTSFDVGLLANGTPSYAEEPVFEKYPVSLPVIDISSIGAGGGSIAWLEPETGVLRIGPQSAGAVPGPVCYDRGGTRSTITDANVVLGRINPDYFLGGEMRLSREKAMKAIDEQIAGPLGITAEDAAVAMINIVDAQMANAIRKVTVERGRDPSRLTVFGYGGAAGLHVGAYARTLGCAHVVIPMAASVFSAFGIATASVKKVTMLSDPSKDPFDLTRWRRHFDRLEASLKREFEEENLPAGSLSFSWAVDLQFSRQTHTIRVPISAEQLARNDGGEEIIDCFTSLYEERHGVGTSHREAGVEVMTFVVEGSGRLPIPARTQKMEERHDAAPREQRSIYFRAPNGYELTPIFSMSELGPGAEVQGPAVVEAEDTTVLVNHGDAAWVDGFFNIRIDVGANVDAISKSPLLHP